MTARIASQGGDDARLPSDIIGLDRVSRPVWVYDPQAVRLLYGNPAAFLLWEVDSLAALRALRFEDIPPASRIRAAETLADVRQGDHKADVWTLFPGSAPRTIQTVSSHIALTDGSSAMLFEASLIDVPPDYLRALEAARQLTTVVSLYGLDGVELFGNPAAIETYADRRSFTDRTNDTTAARDAWRQAVDAGQFRGRLSMRTGRGPKCHDVTLHRTQDPITGPAAILSYESDDGEHVAAEAYLADRIEALDAASARADAANAAKSVFLANMSHEIRTPLNGVLAMADLLCRSDLGPAQQEAAHLIQNSGRSLERLLCDILQLAQIEAGGLTLADEVFDAPAVARDVANLKRLKAAETGATVELRVALADGPGRRGDALRFRQILTNLVSNAVKFTPGGSVRISLKNRAGGVRLLVEDTGVGFGEDQRSRIFERFQQADGSITRRFGGAGLGLAITSELVALMGGRIGCHSKPGAGSRFWVDLPLPPVALISPGTAEETEDEDLHGLHVLVADDHPVNRRIMELILEPLGADVVSVENGAEAVDAVEHGEFDVVLMDMQMPVMDGLEATRSIVAADGPPVVMVSANGTPEHVEAAMDAGAVAHVTKPIEPATLIEAVCAATDEIRTSGGQPETNDEPATAGDLDIVDRLARSAA